jgi:outer membrane protein
MTAAVMIALLLARTAVATPPRSPEPQVLRTLADCYAAALERSETVAQQRELVLQAHEHVRQAGGAVLPSLAAVAGWQWQESAGSSALQQSLAPTSQTTARITATQPLFRGGREYAALRAARRLETAQQDTEQQAEVQLYKDVAAAYYAVLSAERDLVNLADQLKAYDARIVELIQWEAIGRSRTSEKLTAQAARANLEAVGVQLRGGLAQARETFAFLTGLPMDTPVADETGEVPAPADLATYLAALDNRPDVAAARSRAEAASDAVWVATGAVLPSVDLIGDYYMKRSGVLDNVHWDAQLALTIPIFTGGQTFSRIREARSVRRQSDQGLSLARRGAETEIRVLYDRLQADRGQVEALARAVELAQQSYDRQVEEYRQGLVNNLDVLTALNTLQGMRQALDRARYLVHTDMAQLEAASGLRQRQ